MRGRQGGEAAGSDRDELAAAVAGLDAGGKGPWTLLSQRPMEYRSSFPLVELRVAGRDGRVERLVLKDLGGGAEDGAWRVKPAFLHDPLREIAAYRDVLAPYGVAAPAWRGAVVDPPRGRFWLFLEHVGGVPLWQSGDLAVWRRTAEWLASLHTRFADLLPALPPRLLVHDRGYYERWLERARRYVRWPTVRADTAGFAALADRTAEAVGWLEGQRPTFLHGELYPSNVLVEAADAEPRIRPLDWEMAGVGPGLLDLATLVSGGGWRETERAALADAYRAALPAALRPSRPRLRAGLDHARVLRAVQWLGWSAAWTPPPEHRHDWLAEALAPAAGTSRAPFPQGHQERRRPARETARSPGRRSEGGSPA